MLDKNEIEEDSTTKFLDIGVIGYMEVPRRQCLFKIVLRHVFFDTTLPILPSSGADDGVL